MAEYNLIQKPNLIRRLQTLLGMRQAHITPTLNEGVQAVVILADSSDEPTDIVPVYSAAAFVATDGTPGQVPVFSIGAPGGAAGGGVNDVRMVLRRVIWHVFGAAIGAPQLKAVFGFPMGVNNTWPTSIQPVDQQRGHSMRNYNVLSRGRVNGGYGTGFSDLQWTFNYPGTSDWTNGEHVLFLEFPRDEVVIEPGFCVVFAYDASDAANGYCTAIWEEHDAN